MLLGWLHCSPVGRLPLRHLLLRLLRPLLILLRLPQGLTCLLLLYRHLMLLLLMLCHLLLLVLHPLSLHPNIHRQLLQSLLQGGDIVIGYERGSGAVKRFL